MKKNLSESNIEERSEHDNLFKKVKHVIKIYQYLITSFRKTITLYKVSIMIISKMIKLFQVIEYLYMK